MRLANAVRGLLPSPRLRAGARFRRGARVRVVDGRVTAGEDFTVLRNTEFQGLVKVGNGVFINRDGYIRSRTTIGDNVSIGPFVRLITDSHVIGPTNLRAAEPVVQPISVGRGVWIGACVIVLPGVSIGDGCVVAAGSVVAQDVPSNVLVAGVPARVIRHLE